MKDTVDAAIDVQRLINKPEVKSLLTGTIWLGERPAGRQSLSDIVINSGTVNNMQYQIGFVEVNIYWPNMKEAPNTGLADQANLRRVGKVVSSFLDTQWEETFSLEIENAGKIFKDLDGSNYYNIGCRYRALQDNYKNI
jgi:hypothetical protein